MANTPKTANEEAAIPLLELDPPLYEDADPLPCDNVGAPKTYVRQRRFVAILAITAALIVAWAPFAVVFVFYRHVHTWSPVVYSLGVNILVASAVLLTALLSVAALVKLDERLVARGYIKPNLRYSLPKLSFLASLVVIPLLFVFAVERCNSGKLRVIVQVRTSSTEVRATVMFPPVDDSITDDVRELALHRVNDSAATFGLLHAVDGYAITYDFISHTARASDAASAVFGATDESMEISFPGGTYTIVVDAAHRDTSVYGSGEHVLRLTGHRCRILGLCASKFALGDDDIRARARVLFPLGLMMYDLASDEMQKPC